MSASHAGQSCGNAAGWFRLNALETPAGGSVRLSIDFDIRCYPFTRAVRGQLRMNADAQPRTVGDISSSHPSPIAPGTPVTLTVDATAGSISLEYRFMKRNPGGSVDVLREYSFANAANWTPSASDAGTYTIVAWVRERGSTASFDEERTLYPVHVGQAPAALLSVTPSTPFPIASGTRIVWTALARGGSDRLQFKFWRYSYARGSWRMERDWSTDPTWWWATTPADEGRHVLQVWARSGASPDIESFVSSDDFELGAPTGSWVLLTSEPGEHIFQGHVAFFTSVYDSVTVTGNASSVKVDSGTVWTHLGSGIDRALEPGLYEHAMSFFTPVAELPAISISLPDPPGDGRRGCLDRGTFRILELEYTATNDILKLAADVEHHCGAAAPALFAAVRINSSFPLFNLVSLSANVPSVVGPGTNVEWRAGASSGTGRVEYKFWLYSLSTGTWSVLQDWTQDSTAGLSAAAPAGQYFVQVWARTVGSNLDYQDWRASEILTIVPSPPQIYGVERIGRARAGSALEFRAAAGGGRGDLEFKFWALRRSTGVWSVLRDYASDPTFEWALPLASTGEYTIQVWAREVGTPGDPAAWTAFDVTVAAPKALVLTGAVGEPRLNGTTVTLTAPEDSLRGGPIERSFSFDGGASVLWRVSVSRLTAIVPGTYVGSSGASLSIWRNGVSCLPSNSSVTVHEYSTDGHQSRLAVDFEQTCTGATVPLYGGIRWNSVVEPLALTAVTTTADPGGSIAMSAIGSSMSGPVEYKFYARNEATRAWTLVRDYGGSHTVTWMPPAPAAYLVQVWMRRQGQTVEYERWKNSDTVTAPTLAAAPRIPVETGETSVWTAVASGGVGPLQYQFWLSEPGTGWRVLQPWSSGSEVEWTPLVAGSYNMQVWVRSAGSTADYDAWQGTGSFVVLEPATR
jgi:hypothetical protein